MLKLPIGLGESCRTRLCRITPVPDGPPAHNRRQIDLVRETAAVLFIGQDIRGQGETTPSEHRHETLAAKCTDQAIERHGGEMPDYRTELQTEAPMRC